MHRGGYNFPGLQPRAFPRCLLIMDRYRAHSHAHVHTTIHLFPRRSAARTHARASSHASAAAAARFMSFSIHTIPTGYPEASVCYWPRVTRRVPRATLLPARIPDCGSSSSTSASFVAFFFFDRGLRFASGFLFFCRERQILAVWSSLIFFFFFLKGWGVSIGGSFPWGLGKLRCTRKASNCFSCGRRRI